MSKHHCKTVKDKDDFDVIILVQPFEIFEDSNDWWFELDGKIYGPFEDEEEAGLAQDSMISDSYRDEQLPGEYLDYE